jgi:hypothetical protein
MHTLKGVLWFGVLALPCLWLIWRLLEPVARRRRYSGGLLDPRAAALLLAGVLVASTLLTPIENTISRRYEAEADWTALQATGDGAGMVSLQRRLALSGVSSLQPPGWAVDLLFDHPPLMSRIAVARSVQHRLLQSNQTSHTRAAPLLRFVLDAKRRPSGAPRSFAISPTHGGTRDSTPTGILAAATKTKRSSTG